MGADVAPSRIRVLFGSVDPCDYVTFGGRQLNPSLTEQWWKVESVARNELCVINKGGSRRTVNCATYTGIKIYKWRKND